MQKTEHFDYFELDVIPPRCRKPRDIFHKDGVVTLDIREIESAATPFPVALTRRDVWSGKDVPYHWFEGQLWQPYEPNASGWSGSAQEARAYFDRLNLIERWGGHATLDQRVERAHGVARRYLIVDGLVYTEADEPMYEVCTFGLGHNHGGTGLMTTHHYNSNIPSSRYFNALQFEQAKALATRIALGRGDDQSVPGFADRQTITVFMSEVITANPAQDYGGEGDPFLNSLDALTAGAESAGEAGLLAMASLFISL